MKRVLAVLAAIALTALITFLAVTKHLSDARAARLDQALQDAESRVMALEMEIDEAKQKIGELSVSQESLQLQLSSRRRELANSPPQADRQTTLTPAAIAVPEASKQTDPTLIGGAVAGLPAGWARYVATASSGVTNLVRIEGTSSIHAWQVEGHLIGGSADFGTGLPSNFNSKSLSDITSARASVFIPVRSLKSVEADGQLYSDTMNEIMYGKLRAAQFNRISFTLTTLSPVIPSPETNSVLTYQAKGDLTVAGVTNSIAFPLTLQPTPDGRVKVSGSAKVKMTDFKISPPSPSFAGVSITTGDEVILKFVWWLNRARTLEAAR